MLIQNEIIKAHNEKQEKSVVDTAEKQPDVPIKVDESPKIAKNPYHTGYNPPAVVSNHESSLFDELPPEFEQEGDGTHNFEQHHDPFELTPEDLSEFADFNQLQP